MTCSNSCPECSPTTPERRALKPTISICNGPRSYLLIGRDTLRSLNNPEYITLLVNWDVPSVAVMECQPGDSMSFKVPENLSSRHGFRIFGKSFIGRLSETQDSAINTVARYQGSYDPEKKAVIFDLYLGEHELKEKGTEEPS